MSRENTLSFKESLLNIYWDIYYSDIVCGVMRFVSKIFSKHDQKIYWKRLGNAILGRQYIPMCCYTYSLDYSIAKTFSEGLDYLIPLQLNNFVIEDDRKEELLEMQQLWKDYISEGFIPETEGIHTYSEEYQKAYSDKLHRMFELTEKHFISLRY